MKSKPNLNITVKGAQLLQDLDQQKAKENRILKPQFNWERRSSKQKQQLIKEKSQFGMRPFNLPMIPKIRTQLSPSLMLICKNPEEIIGKAILDLQNVENSPDWLISVPLYKNQNDMGSLELEFDFIGKQKPVAKKDKSELGSERQLDKSNNNNSISSKQGSKQQQDNNYDFQTVNIETQQAELKKWISQIQEREYINTLKYLEDSRLQAAIERALNQVAEQNPKDQIDYFADCLLKFK